MCISGLDGKPLSEQDSCSGCLVKSPDNHLISTSFLPRVCSIRRSSGGKGFKIFDEASVHEWINKEDQSHNPVGDFILTPPQKIPHV